MSPSRALAALSASGVALLLLSSCGIPSESAPEVVQEAPSDFDEPSSVEVETFNPTDNAKVTVENFLKASAGDPTGRNDRLGVFTEHPQEFSAPSDGIRLLDGVDVQVDQSDDFLTATVTVTGRVVGTYLQDGQVRMHTPPSEYEEEFVLERERPGEVFTMTKLPLQVVLLHDQFETSYEQAPLYFQATGQNGLLVPDLRWIYNRLDRATERDLRLAWLLQGPSDFTGQAVRSAIPNRTIPEVSEEDGTLVIDLDLGETAESGGQDSESIAAQIAWSLGLNGPFELRVDGAEVESGTLDEWRDWNAVQPPLDPTGYFISGDRVWQFDNIAVRRSSAEHPWVGFEQAGLRQVAVSEDQRIAAIVADDGGTHLQVSVGGEMTTIEGVDGDLRDPQWLGSQTVLLIDDGVLTAVTIEDGSTQVLGGSEVVSAALAPDGHRVAYVADGRAWAAPLSHLADDNFQLGDSRRIGLGITGVNDVAWSSEDFLWVAGVDSGDDQLFRVAIDNSQYEVQLGTSNFPRIQQIAANPADPLEPNQNRGEPVVVVINSELYRVHTSDLEPIDNGNGEPVQGTAPFTVLG